MIIEPFNMIDERSMYYQPLILDAVDQQGHNPILTFPGVSSTVPRVVPPEFLTVSSGSVSLGELSTSLPIVDVLCFSSGSALEGSSYL